MPGDPQQSDETCSQSEQSRGFGSGDGCSNKSHIGCGRATDKTNDLTVVVDPLRGGATEPRHNDGTEAAARIQEALRQHSGVDESYDLVAIVDPAGNRTTSPRGIDGGKAAARIQESVLP